MTELETQHLSAQSRALTITPAEIEHTLRRIMQGDEAPAILAFLTSCQEAAMAQVSDRAQGGELRHYNAGVLHAFIHLRSILRTHALTTTARHRPPAPSELPVERPG